MKKLLLPALFSLTILQFAGAQVIDTVFTEHFDQPSGADSVTTGSFVGTQPPTSTHGFVAFPGLYTSPNHSFRGKGQMNSGQGTRFHYVDTKPFSTEEYVLLDFKHICKINRLNKARIKVSVDSGRTFSLATGKHYRGNSIFFPIPGLAYFNDASYSTAVGGDLWLSNKHGSAFIPKNSWWQSELFDLSGLASDTVNHTGYENVIIRFEFELQYDLSQLDPNTYNAGETGYGWLLEDIIVTTAGCELEPPVLNWDLQPVPCFFNNPQGSLVEKSSETYRVAVEATDRISGMQDVELCYKIHHSDNTNTSIVCIPMQPDITGTAVGAIKANGSDVYYADISGVEVHDTVYYYVSATDNACPNETKSPVLAPFFKFWVDPSLPEMCGGVNCSKFPETINVTDVSPDADGTLWTENFETSRWVPGNNGTSNENNGHRGEFPIFPDGAWVVFPSQAPENKSLYAWSIGTSALPKAHGSTTGPADNHTPGGNKYIFADYSHGQVPAGADNVLTLFQTPCIDLTKETRCLAFEFYYHMFGAALDASDPSVLRADIIYSDNPNDNNNTAKRIVGQTQFSATDDWKKMIFSLDPYLGQYVQIRFVAVKKVNVPDVPAGFKDQGDIAIDDLRIFQPDVNDFEVLEVLSPKNGYCYYSSNEPVTMVVRNNGCLPQTNIPVSFRVGSGAPVYDTIKSNLALGDTMTFTFSQGADLSAPNPNYVVTVSTNLPGDIRVANDSKQSEEIENIPPISQFPYIEDFENGTAGSQNIGNNLLRFMPGLGDKDFEWRVGEGLTPTRYSGPYSGFYYKGKYLYTHTSTSGAANSGLNTYLRTICLDLSTLSSPVVGFYYHMYGSSALLEMELEVSKANEDLNTWTTIPNSKILPAGQQNKELDDWKFMRVDLSNYAGESIKIRFKAVRTKVEIEPGNSQAPAYESNFAIDKIMVYDEAANDAGVLAITEPLTNVMAGASLDPKVKITNFGSTALSSVPVTISITPLCGPNQGQTTTYSGSASLPSPLNTGSSSDALTLSGLNINWPEGEYEICAYTTLGGDNAHYNDTVCRRLTGYSQYNITWGTSFDPCNYSVDGFYIGDNYDASGDISRSYRQWQLGTPKGARINRAQSSPNAWVTNLAGAYLDSSDEFLYIPRLDNFDTIVKARLEFYHNLDMPTATPLRRSPAAGAIEYKSGNKWKSVGSDFIQEKVGTNWYYSEYGALSLEFFNGNPGFVGQSRGNWIFSSYPMSELNYAQDVQDFRFHFKARRGGGGSYEGWGIDDFEIYVPPQNSAAPIKVKTLDPLIFPAREQWLKITVQNTGAKNLEEYKVQVRIADVNGNFKDLGTEHVVLSPLPLIEGAKHAIDFDYQWESQDVTVGLHQVQVITSRPNNKQDNLVTDDTLYWSFTVLDTIDFRAGSGDTLYCNDFEPNNGVAPWLATNADAYQDGNFSWEWGVPNQFGLAHSGARSWVTGTNVNYPKRDSSALITPIFLVDSGQTLEMGFYHWIKSERFHDGGNVDVSFDGGITWQTVGWGLRDQDERSKEWYNTETVTSLDIIRPGWTGHSEDWEKARWKFYFDSDVQAIFRFRFASDYDVEDNGWAVDDFCLRHAQKPYQRIGTEEPEMPQEKIVTELSPNPTKSISRLSLYLPTPKTGRVVVVNSVGQLMESREVTLNDGVSSIPFDASRWESGMYIIKLYLDDDVITRKLIIAR